HFQRPRLRAAVFHAVLFPDASGADARLQPSGLPLPGCGMGYAQRVRLVESIGNAAVPSRGVLVSVVTLFSGLRVLTGQFCVMRHTPVFTWRVTCPLPNRLQAVRNWLTGQIDLDRVVTDTIRTFPQGNACSEEERHRLGSYFSGIDCISDNASSF